jgi:hypothetical protein
MTGRKLEKETTNLNRCMRRGQKSPKKTFKTQMKEEIR